MVDSTHYETLEVSRTATQGEIKQAYRRLAKRFHPDSHQQTASHEKITQVNAAYEILSDPQQRAIYDRQIGYGFYHSVDRQGNGSNGNGTQWQAQQQERHQRTAAAQKRHQQQQTGQEQDEQIERWLKQVYQPVFRLLGYILNPLKAQLNQLAADPFDDALLADFQGYLDDCRDDLEKAQKLFQSMANPPSVAGTAAHLYYCLNQVSDGLDELERFGMCFDDHYLHTGQELFRIAGKLKKEAQSAMKEVLR